MARYLYAATLADYIVSSTTGLPIPNAVVTVWTARTAGSQITDLQNLSGQGVTQVTADAQGFIAFYGPDSMTDNVWLYSGSGPRLLARTVENFALKVSDAAKLDRAGGTMTGALTLSGAPTVDLHAATKKYVDDNRMNKTGDTMTGDLVIANSADLIIGANGGPRAGLRQQTDYPLIIQPTTNAGAAIGAAEFYYNNQTNRWQVESDFKVEGATTLTGATTVGGLTATGVVTLSGSMASDIAMSGHKITGLAAATANGDALRYEQVGMWQTYVPTLTGSNSNPTGWTVGGKYTRVGNLITAKFWLRADSASKGAGDYRIALPVEGVGHVAAVHVGDVRLSPPGSQRAGWAYISNLDTTGIYLCYQNSTPGLIGVTSDLPAAWEGYYCEISGTITYEAAT